MKLKDYKGIEIMVSEYDGEFRATVNEMTKGDKWLAALEAWIDRQTKRIFTPKDVLYFDGLRGPILAKATSITDAHIPNVVVDRQHRRIEELRLPGADSSLDEIKKLEQEKTRAYEAYAAEVKRLKDTLTPLKYTDIYPNYGKED